MMIFSKWFKCICLFVCFGFYNSCVSQNKFQDLLEFESVQTFKTQFNYRSARSLISATHENELILMGEDPNQIDKKTHEYSGLIYNLDNETETPIKFSVDPKLLNNYDRIKGIAFNESYLFVNFIDVQLLFDRNKHEARLKDNFSYHNISGSIYIDDNGYRVSRTSKYDRRDSDNGNYFEIYPFNLIKEQSIKFDIEINGVALNDMGPSKMVAFNKNWVTWVEPIDNSLHFYNINTKEIDTVFNQSKSWIMIDDELLEEITDKKNGAYDLVYTLREVIETSSRVWEIKYIDETTLMSFYHHPTDTGFNFYCNIYTLENGMWGLGKGKSNLSLKDWRGFGGNLNVDSFPFAYKFVSSKSVFTKDYTCLILEQNSDEFEGKKFSEFFETIPEITFRLRMHVFKNTF